MLRASIIFAFLGTAAIAQPHHCIADDGTERADIRFEQKHNGVVDDGDFDVRVTSGFRNFGKVRQFIYCLENLRSSSVHFRWDGPTPSKLLQNKLGRPPSDGRTGKVKVHRDTIGDSDFGVRKLNLRLAEGEDYETFDVETIVEKAGISNLEVVPVQNNPTMPTSSGADFAASLAELDGPLVLSAGIVFDMPSSAENWPEFLSGGGDGTVESSRVMAKLVLRYDPETLDVTVETAMGFSESFPAPDPEKYFSSLSLDFGDGFGSFGFESSEDIRPVFEGELPGIQSGFVGITRTTKLGSLAEFGEDQRALSRGNLPITLLLDGALLAEFGLEVVGAPLQP